MKGASGDGDGSVISSDVTWPVKFLKHLRNPWRKPEPVKGWYGWCNTLSAAFPDNNDAPGRCPHWPCWICHQLYNMFPEYFEDGFKEGEQK
jgi:hypothetical protein